MEVAAAVTGAGGDGCCRCAHATNKGWAAIAAIPRRDGPWTQRSYTAARRLAVGTLAREVAALAPRRLACRLATEGPELGGSSAGAGGCVFGAEERARDGARGARGRGPGIAWMG